MTGNGETNSGDSSPHLGDGLLSTYIDGECSAEERLLAERHLSSCAECATSLDDLRTVVAMLKALPVAPVPRSFAIPATTAKPALAWFYRLRLASAVASLAFVTLLVFNIAYISVPLGAVTLTAEYPASTSATAPQGAQSNLDAAKSLSGAREEAKVERAAAAPSASESATGTAGPEREMASTVFEVKVVPIPSPLAGYEWYLLVVAVALSVSTYGLWFARLRQ